MRPSSSDNSSANPPAPLSPLSPSPSRWHRALRWLGWNHDYSLLGDPDAAPESTVDATAARWSSCDGPEPGPSRSDVDGTPAAVAEEGKPVDVDAVGRGTGDGRRDAATQSRRRPNGPVKLTAAENRRVLRKIDLAILPIMLGVYFLQALDKATLAYASVFGIIEDTNLQGEEYSWLGSIVYIAQLVMQPLVAFFLVKLPIGKFTFAVVLGWGIILSCMAAAKNFTGLMVTRFLLGAFEASIAPAFVAIVQMWWRRAEQPVRVASWYSMNGITTIVGSLMAWGLGHISSPLLKPYQIIFLFCGLITVAFSFMILIFLPDTPMDAPFLKGHDKQIALERLRMNQMGVMSRIWKWEHLWESVVDLKTWFWFAMMFSVSIPSGGISTFGPLIVKSFGFDSFTTILFNIPFGALQIAATMGSAFLAYHFGVKGPVIMMLCIPPIIGCFMLMTVDHTTGSKATLLIGYYLISVYPGITPLVYSWSAANTAGDTKRKCTTGMLFIGQSIGNIIGPLLYTTEEAPEYHRGLLSNLIFYILIVILAVLATLYLHLLNRKHGAQREALGKSAIIVDTSMVIVDDDASDTDSIAPVADVDAAPLEGQDQAKNVRAGDRAFDDETDLENEDFIFVY